VDIRDIMWHVMSGYVQDVLLTVKEQDLVLARRWQNCGYALYMIILCEDHFQRKSCLKFKDV
jgi:hypothetical protein